MFDFLSCVLAAQQPVEPPVTTSSAASVPLCFIRGGCCWKQRVSRPSRARGSSTSQQCLLEARRHGCMGRQRASRGSRPQSGRRRVHQPNGNILLLKKNEITGFTHTEVSSSILRQPHCSAQIPKYTGCNLPVKSSAGPGLNNTGYHHTEVKVVLTFQSAE